MTPQSGVPWSCSSAQPQPGEQLLSSACFTSDHTTLPEKLGDESLWLRMRMAGLAPQGRCRLPFVFLVSVPLVESLNHCLLRLSSLGTGRCCSCAALLVSAPMACGPRTAAPRRRPDGLVVHPGEVRPGALARRNIVLQFSKGTVRV